MKEYHKKVQEKDGDVRVYLQEHISSMLVIRTFGVETYALDKVNEKFSEHKGVSFMEQNGIWYLPLKGIVLKDYYPAVGMRQMSDNDILFDSSFCDEMQEYMESQGYESVSVGVGNHDVYTKAPVYNFELHRTLYSKPHQGGWTEYYRNIKERLVLSKGTSYGYCFTDEDFYVYLKAKEQKMDFVYIEKECEVLGIREFEKQNRSLCKKVFSCKTLKGIDTLRQTLSESEMEMLLYYLTSGTYGTMERGIENKVKKLGKKSSVMAKLMYMWNRVFPGYETYIHYAAPRRSKALQSLIGWFRRLMTVLFSGKRRAGIVREIELLKKIK